ncbi:ABC transporter substrate-binding protein [Hydrogenophaga sp. 5NK40-0174]|uniref:ABC transporter substrate-binding protein n=1 Tax=Hydrogenophaga sp. 5NK40-0174 TaxID=3127649 RepID=UPI003109A383
MELRRRDILMSMAAGSLSLNAFPALAAGNEIVLAQIGPFTVLPAPDAKLLNEGFQACVADINSKGGIQGRKLKLLTLDDAYSYEGFMKQLPVAREAGAVALLNPIGSATLKRVLDEGTLDQQDMLVLNAIPGASVLRDPGHPLLLHVRAGDEEQIEKIVAHAQILTIQSLGVLYQNIPMGSSGFASAQRAAKALGSMRVEGSESAPDAASLKAAAEKLAASNVQSALVVGAPKFMGEGIGALRNAGMSQQLFTLSYLPVPALQKFAGEKGARGVGIAQTFPNPSGIKLPVQRELARIMQTHMPEVKNLSGFHMEAMIVMRTFEAAAKRASSISGAAIAQAAHRMGEIDLGGFRIDFSDSNVGSHWVDIAVAAQNGRLMY